MLLTDGDVTRGLLERKRPFVRKQIDKHWKEIVKRHPALAPPTTRKYAKSIADTIGEDFEGVLSSKPVRNYWKKVR